MLCRLWVLTALRPSSILTTIAILNFYQSDGRADVFQGFSLWWRGQIFSHVETGLLLCEAHTQVSCPYFCWVTCLYVPDARLLSVICCKCLPPLSSLSFVFFIGLFDEVQSVWWWWWWYDLSAFSFTVSAFCIIQKFIALNHHKDINLSPESFQILLLVTSYLLHLKLWLFYVVKRKSNFLFLCECRAVPAPFTGDHPLFLLSYATLVIYGDHIT